jgi:hypothetical protein
MYLQVGIYLYYICSVQVFILARNSVISVSFLVSSKVKMKKSTEDFKCLRGLVFTRIISL